VDCRSWSRVACALLAPLCLARGAGAELRWQGSEQCGPSAEQVAAAERALADPRAPRVEVALSQERARWTAKVSASYASGSAGVREISARSCAELLRGVSVAVSLLEPTASEPEVDASEPATAAAVEASAQTDADFERAPSTAAAQPSAPVQHPARASARAPASPQQDGGFAPSAATRRGAPAWSVRASSLFGLAGNSTPELGAALSAARWWRSWGTRLGLSARQPLGSLRAEHGVSVELQRFDSSLELCARSVRTVRWGLCAGPRLEVVRGMSLGLSSPASDLIWLPELGAASWLSLPMTERWALSAELRGNWSARRAFARVEPWGRVYELPQLDSALLLGAEWSL
jgi:hypothetical protein